jgi:hypothetical protein
MHLRKKWTIFDVSILLPIALDLEPPGEFERVAALIEQRISVVRERQ